MNKTEQLLAEVFGVSEVRIELNLGQHAHDSNCTPSKVFPETCIRAFKSELAKCQRCWRHREDVTNGLCARCTEVVKLHLGQNKTD